MILDYLVTVRNVSKMWCPTPLHQEHGCTFNILPQNSIVYQTLMVTCQYNIACLGGQLNVVKYLVTEMKCNPKSPGYKGRTPLHQACGSGHMDIIKYLITEHGCDPALPDNDGDMPIHIACLGGKLNVVKYLVTEMKCNPKSPGYKGRTPLHQACSYGHHFITRQCLYTLCPYNHCYKHMKWCPTFTPWILDVSSILDHRTPLHKVVTQHYQTMMVTCQYTLLVLVAN